MTIERPKARAEPPAVWRRGDKPVYVQVAEESKIPKQAAMAAFLKGHARFYACVLLWVAAIQMIDALPIDEDWVKVGLTIIASGGLWGFIYNDRIRAAFGPKFK